MRKLAYVLMVIATMMIIIGIIMQIIKNDCNNKTIKEYFESDMCQYVGSYRD